MIKKLLIANRGEIACRAIRACRELGIVSAVVYSDIDRDGLPVQLADEHYCIGSAQAKKSYLDLPGIIAAAKGAGADAIYPGYGFLAENAEFAEACRNEGLIFVGPSPEAIRDMGDKAVARQTMKKAGVPVIPGTEGIVSDIRQAEEAAEAIGYPVLIKAAAGGGGKGMRVVNQPAALQREIRQAMQEAERNFGNSGVYLEKYLTDARHVEIQIMADFYGAVVYLGERDCSTQRRHQKLLEEAPSPVVDENMRARMGSIAVRAAEAVHYAGAGTVEFIVDSEKNFYFMEMNTRIQVEHPVTEAVTGTDLVKAQLLVAGGEHLPWKQEDIKVQGWAVECRINAEDYRHGFIPCPGTITRFRMPQQEHVRIDSVLYENCRIPPFYDSMIAKVIAWGSDRKEAIERMLKALGELEIEGVQTTIGLHRKILSTEAFQQGKIDTGYLERHLDEIMGITENKRKDG